MSSDTEVTTITAVYRDRGAAERAVEQLTAIGLPDSTLEARGGETLELHGGLYAGFIEALAMPQRDRDLYERHAREGAIVVVARDVPASLRQSALRILDDEAVDIDADEAEAQAQAEEPGAIGTMGGEGRATGEVDRLTGERIGSRPDDGAPGAGEERRAETVRATRARVYPRRDV